MKELLNKINFPYPSLRKGQDIFLKEVYTTINENKNIMISAPTGLGKTISALAPALAIAKEKNMTVICLTSRQTQANQIIKTIKDINDAYKIKNKNLDNPNSVKNLNETNQLDESNETDKPNKKIQENTIRHVAFIGKRNMCVHSQRDIYPASDFNDFCKKMKERGKCKFYKNAKNTDFSEQIEMLLSESSKSFLDVEEFVNLCYSNSFCPYELATKKAYKSDIIICDYNYLFARGIKEGFLGKIGRTIEECILVVDEAHNLPDRIRASNSFSLNSDMIKKALGEMKDFIETNEHDHFITNISDTFDSLYSDKLLGDKSECLILKQEFIDTYLSNFAGIINIDEITEKLDEIVAIVKEDKIISHIAKVSNFLKRWQSFDENSFLRLLEKDIKKDKTILSLKIKCIDPSDIASETINDTKSTIFMSGTLSPIKMYKDILGVENCKLLELESPFSKKNQLTLVIDDVTSKYSNRTNKMYEKIAEHIKTILFTAQKKNGIVFFPSYFFMENVLQFINENALERKVLKEKRHMTKDEKEKFIDEFKQFSSQDETTVLFGITSGSFSEGLDLPNKMLELVIVVGLPLGVPNLYTKTLIEHFQRKFKQGQMYGYISPAMNKIIQAAGRCIRTEEDKGIIILMDNRFLWSMYARTFPVHWHMKKISDYVSEIEKFD